MTVLRRLTALVTMFVTVLLVLTESGFACSADGMKEMRMDGPAAIAPTGIPMADMPMPDAAERPMRGEPAGGDHAPAQAPCRFPWAPAGCRDMAPCAPAALAVAAVPVVEPTPAPHPVVQGRVSPPRSVETPPELPPPRA